MLSQSWKSGEAIEKSPILLSQYWKNYHFERVTKIISYFDGSNNIFADCIRAPRTPPPFPCAGERGSGLTGGGSTTNARQPTIVPNDDKRGAYFLYILFFWLKIFSMKVKWLKKPLKLDYVINHRSSRNA